MQESVVFSCPNCGQELETDGVCSGVQIECPGCGQNFILDVTEEPIPREKPSIVRKAARAVVSYVTDIPSRLFHALPTLGIVLLLFAAGWFAANRLCEGTYAAGPVKWLSEPWSAELCMKYAEKRESLYHYHQDRIAASQRAEEMSVGFSRMHSGEEFENEENIFAASMYKGMALYAQMSGCWLCILYTIGFVLIAVGVWKPTRKDSIFYFPVGIALLVSILFCSAMVYFGAVQGRNIECARRYGKDFRTRMPEVRESMLKLEKQHDVSPTCLAPISAMKS